MICIYVRVVKNGCVALKNHDCRHVHVTATV